MRQTKPTLSNILLICLSLYGLSACRKSGNLLPNQAPETSTSVSEINLTGENRLNSLVKLSWWGSDPDGYVVGYEFSFDQETWVFTENQDSTFLFSIPKGSDTVDIDFWVRSVDDAGDSDKTPAYLRVPLKNTSPEIKFVSDLIPSDTLFNVLTLAWDATDLDGFSSIEAIEIKINEGDWTQFSTLVETEETAIASLYPIDLDADGLTTARLVNKENVEVAEIPGLNVNGLNNLYIRAVDVAGSISSLDTLANFYFKGRSSDLLVLGTSSSSPNDFYLSNLNTIGQGFDFIDLFREDRKNSPRIWNPTFELLLRQYDKVLIYAKEDLIVNPQTNDENIFLEFASSGMEAYLSNGGKMFISSSLPNTFTAESALFGILPIDSLSSSEGQARLPFDSLAVGLNGYPSLVSNALIGGLDPVYPSTDAEIIYSAQLTRANGWTGPSENAVGVRRRVGSNTNLVFLSVELHRVNKDEVAIESLFRKVFEEEFAW